MAAEVSTGSMPQLQSVQKAMAIPTVGAAVGQVGAFYSRVKGAHSLLEWALSRAEAGVSLAAHAAAPLVGEHVAAGDARVAAAIAALEQKVPLLTQQPKVIVDTTKQAVLDKISPHVNKVCGAKAAAEQRVKSLKELSWARANALLSTAAGQRALQGVDEGAGLAMRLLDYYLPPVPADAAEGAADGTTMEIAPAASDPARHTVHTVGRLSSVAARRVCASLACRLHRLRGSAAGQGIELDVRRYIAALLAALHPAKVTSEQQQRETETEHRQEARQREMAATASPPAAAAPPQPQHSAPPTAAVVKTTPEGKSKVANNGDGPKPNNNH